MSGDVIRLEVLGGLRVTVEERDVPRASLARRGARDLLAFLSVAREHRVRKEEAIDVLWPEASADSASNKLYMALHALRAAIEPAKRNRAKDSFICSAGSYIELNAARAQVDADEFHRLTSLSGGSHEREWIAAVEAYRGPLLCDDMESSWIVPHREDFRIRFHKTALQLTQLWAGRGELERAIALLLRIVREDVTNETARRQLILLTAMRGDRPEALRQFDLLARALAEQLGVKPDADTLKLVERVRRGEISCELATAEADAAPLAPQESSVAVATSVAEKELADEMDRYRAPGSLPLEARARDIEALLTRIEVAGRVRLLVHGLPGVGKSAVAANLAAELTARGRKVAWLNAVGLSVDALTLALTDIDRRASKGLADIVFVDGVPQSDIQRVAAKIESCRASVVLTTRLPCDSFPGVHYRLPPLRVAPAELRMGCDDEPSLGEAERLLLSLAEQQGVERGGASEPLLGASRRQLLAVCRQLDGLPALLHLAARKLVSCSLQELEARLREDRRTVLAGPLAGRHFSEQEEIAGVVEQLGTSAEVVLCALSLASIPLSSAEVAAIARLPRGNVDAALEALCSASLVQRESIERANLDMDPWPSARFAPLMGARWLARERLASSPRFVYLRRSFAESVLSVLAASSAGTAHPDSVIRWADEAADVLAWAVEVGDDMTPSIVLSALRGLWLASGVDPRVQAVLVQLLRRVDLPDPTAALAHLIMSIAHTDRGALQLALSSARSAQARSRAGGRNDYLAFALLQEARVQRRLGHRSTAFAVVDQAEAALRSCGAADAHAASFAVPQAAINKALDAQLIECQLERAANFLGTRGATSQSKKLVGVVSLARDFGESALLVRALVVRGRAALTDGRPDLAVQTLDEAYSIAVARGLSRILGSIRCHRGAALLEQGNVDLASDSFQSALRLVGEQGDLPTSCVAFRGLGAAALYRGNRQLALGAFEQALAIARSAQLPLEEHRCLVMIAVTQLAGADATAARETLRRALGVELGKSAKELTTLLNVAAASFLRERDGERIAGLLQRVSTRLQSSMGMAAPRSSQLLLRSVLGEQSAPSSQAQASGSETQKGVRTSDLRGRAHRVLRAALEAH